VKRGDRIGALILIKTANMATTCTEEVESLEGLEETARGTSGFGSTGIGKLKRHRLAGGGEAKKRRSSSESEEEEETEEESEEETDEDE